MSEQIIIDPKKRYNVYLRYPIAGFGEPGQTGHVDMSAEETKKLIEKGAVERILVRGPSNPMISKEQAAKNRKRFVNKVRRRR